MAIIVGQKAPDFSAKDQNGNTHTLSDYRGRKVALYFYPKDNTPTCTAQSCNLRDNYGSLLQHGIQVLGVSVDSEKKHKNFASKYSLPFPLLADTDHAMVDAYDVWHEKMLFGIKYMGIVRTTFLINEEGYVEKIIDQVKAQDHASQILN